MGTRLSPAERSFNERLKTLLTPPKEEPRTYDSPGVEKVFFQYGTYLELVGGDAPVEQPQVIVWPKA